jgi:hypothetical protein
VSSAVIVEVGEVVRQDFWSVVDAIADYQGEDVSPR